MRFAVSCACEFECIDASWDVFTAARANLTLALDAAANASTTASSPVLQQQIGSAPPSSAPPSAGARGGVRLLERFPATQGFPAAPLPADMETFPTINNDLPQPPLEQAEEDFGEEYGDPDEPFMISKERTDWAKPLLMVALRALLGDQKAWHCDVAGKITLTPQMTEALMREAHPDWFEMVVSTSAQIAEAKAERR